MAQKAEALEAERRPREVVHQLAEARPPLRAVVEVVHRPAAVEAQDQLQPRLPVAVLHQLAQVRLRPLAADVAVPRRPVEAAVHPLLVALERAVEELVAATRTATTGASISMWVGLPLAGATTEVSGTESAGTSGGDDGMSTASAVVGSKPRSVSFGFAADPPLFGQGSRSFSRYRRRTVQAAAGHRAFPD